MPYNYLKDLFHSKGMDYSKTEKIIANYLLDLGGEVSNKTLDELSEETGVSKTTIFNFVTKHGFEGFQSFKIAVAQNVHHSKSRKDDLVVFSDVTAEDTPYVIAQKTIHSSKKLLDELLLSLSNEQLNSALELIKNSKTLHFLGQGSSSIIALDSYQKFIRTKYQCNYVFDHHMQLGYATKLGEDDCVFLFSHSGQTIETINIAKILQKKNVKTIVLTGNAFCELMKYADTAFVVDSEEASLGSEALTARNLYLTIMDILYTSILYSDEESNQKSISDIRAATSTSKLGE